VERGRDETDTGSKVGVGAAIVQCGEAEEEKEDDGRAEGEVLYCVRAARFPRSEAKRSAAPCPSV
jgi:hypothetical protein